jgi:hydrogenase maturation protein HypF
MKNLYIHIEGQVQGVGFRPYVYRLATAFDLKGWVCNGVDGVHMELEGEEDALSQFLTLLPQNVPPLARITRSVTGERSLKYFTAFKIIESTPGGKPNLLITPDVGLCDTCRTEIHDEANPRYQYPFTTCTQCGPRYSIMRALPYDRPVTSMNDFVMCTRCQHEYNDPLDRRYFSQTNSCPECAVDTWLLKNDGELVASHWDQVFPLIVEKLNEGHILALKGIGGYLLLADATRADVIQKLRDRKHRPTKPFALLYPDLDRLQQDAYVSEAEAKAFRSIESPIVLVQVRHTPASGICTRLIAPGLDTIGAMQPFTAMMELVMKAWNKPVIATSANLSGSPILYKDEQALQSLKSIADYFLVHNREIEIAQDDSVVRFTPEFNQPILLRRSRGFAPSTEYDAFSSETILAMGADLKSAFSLQANGRIYTSQYLGDLESFESQESFREALNHMLELVHAKPERIIIDAHPNYYSSQLGRTLAERWNIPVTTVQHHTAHAYAVLAENNLLNSDEPILSVVWDGTGYGTDGNSWGGEFFDYRNDTLERIGHIAYAAVWQGDKMARDPRLSALFFGTNTQRVKRVLESKFSDVVWQYYSKLMHTTPEIHSSSMGRLFDAVACLTGISSVNSFEGESAMHLEAKARLDYTPARYLVKWKGTQLDAENLLNQVCLDLEEGIQPEKIAFKFHVYLADVIHAIVTAKRYTAITLSGGVFQNALLVDLIKIQLKDCQVYTHRSLSPNDESISFGQLAAVTHELAGVKTTTGQQHFTNQH